jgi:hypothetical protein
MGKNDLASPTYKLHNHDVCRGVGGRRCLHKITCITRGRQCSAYGLAVRYVEIFDVLSRFWHYTNDERIQAKQDMDALSHEMAIKKAEGFKLEDFCWTCKFGCKLGTAEATCDAIKIVRQIPCGLVK